MEKFMRRQLVNYEENCSTKIDHYQICVHVIECKHLAWPTMNSYVGVEVGNHKKHTKRKEDTNSPYFDEYFVFEFQSTEESLMDILISLTVHSSSSLFCAKKALGSITMDVATVYAQQDHQFFQEWAVLLSHEDVFSVNKGFIKCTVAILGQWDILKTPSVEGDAREESKTNILNESQVARYVCRVYKAQGNLALHDYSKLICSCCGQKSTTKQKELNSKVYVELKFGNLTGSTSLKHDVRGFVEWNEQIAFVGRFPPLFQKIVIRLKDEHSTKSCHYIAEHTLKMNAVSSDKKEGFSPSFGPAYIHMYAQEGNGCRMYIFRLLFSLDTVLRPSSQRIEITKKSLIEIGPVVQPEKSQEENPENMLVFCNAFHLVHLSKKLDPCKIQIELNFGLQTASTADDTSAKMKKKICKEKARHSDLCSRINGPSKPCLWINSSQSKNIMYRVHQHNIMARIAHFVEEKILLISDELERKDNMEARKLLEELLDQLVEKCKRGFTLLGAKPSTDGTRTTLDWERLRILRREMEFITCAATELKTNPDENSVSDAKRALEVFIQKIYQLMEEPQRPYPEILLSLTSNEKRVSQVRLRIEEIMHSQEVETKGEYCGMKRIIFFKDMQHKGESRSTSDYPILMAAEFLLWAGLSWESSKIYLEGLPSGFDVDEGGKNSENEISASPAKELRYHEKKAYQLRAHIFQGRLVPGADATGLCDPYIKLHICNNTLQTQVHYQTLNPVWDQMLLSKIITLFGASQDLNTVPPTLFIEAMDKDSCGKEEYIGRGVAKLTFKLVSERIKQNEKKLRLEWVELFNAGEYAGDVLSAFEIIELMHEKEALPLTKESSRKHDFHHIPPYIRPHLILYSLKILFWGLRRHGMTHLKLEANPLVTIEVGCKLIKSRSKDQGDGNFTSSLAATDVELPEDFNYCPPITIKVWEKRSFGRLVLVGSHIINCVECIIKREYAYSTWPVPIANKVNPLEAFSEESTDESPEGSDVKRPLLKAQKPRLGNLKLDRLLPRDRANERKITISDDTQNYDWWTKYYESVALEELKSRDKCAGKKPCFAKCKDFSLETGEGIDHIQQNGPELEAEVNEGEGRENDNKKKSILNPILRKVSDVIKMTLRREDKFTKKTTRKNSDEISNDQNSSKEINSVSSFTIYRSELEEQPEFNRFEDWVDSFILFHGKKRRSEFQDRRIVGKFKGSVELNKRDLTQAEGSDDPLESSPDTAHHPTNKTSTNSSSSSVVLATPLLIPTYEVLVRVYVVRAFSLPPKDLSGSSDPYVVVSVGQRISKSANIKRQSKFGRRVSGDRTQYLHQDLNPIFGRCYTVEATLPRDNEITVSVWDWDLGGYDDLIGETKIDIENRFFTKHRATCGISSSYESSGYNAWRDSEKPISILKNLCKYYLLPAPIYKHNHIKIGDSIFYSDNINSSDPRGQQKEKLALEALKQWNKITTKDGKPGLPLVPEHIETRSLYHPKKERISQGKLEMWVDMFHLPKKVENESEDRFLDPSVDITPRKPKVYELRVIIWNTSSVELQDTSIFNEQSSDIYVKGWLYDTHMDGQVTDVHYKSLTGEGNFNWRFIFPLLYLQAEKSMVMIEQETTTEKAVKFFQSLITTSEGQEKAKKLPCHLKLQIWDEDSFTADDFIGAVSLDLTSCPIGAKTAKECKPSMLEEDRMKVDLFKIRHLKGWWPVGKSEVRTGQDGKNHSSLFVLTGKIEAELHMMTDIEANASPAGRGREGPDALPEPKRPDTSFSWLRNPIISFRFVLWKRYNRKIVILLIIVLIVIFLLLMLYSLPGYLVQRLLGVL